ncbi:hypothetical protein [Streptomyces sp. NPDC059398]|uniref:hypothetical protein n=1 Tax=Streptomyces sp. NPDC059398 TaxID=3346820 RepID=UPI00369C046C
MDAIDTPEWADNPRLRAWLAAQEGAFPAWSAGHGGGWDFTPGSLDRLEALVRARFTTWQEADAARESELLQVASWYLGEVQVRHCGARWRCDPDEPDRPPVAGGYPLVTVARTELSEAEQELLAREEEEEGDPTPVVDPAARIRALFTTPDSHLREVVGWFEDFRGWLAGEA